MVELAGRRHLRLGDVEPRAIAASLSVPLPRSRRASSASDGGAMNTSTASGIDRADRPGAAQLDLEDHVVAAASFSSTSRRSVP